jgi:hypothetical protein
MALTEARRRALRRKAADNSLEVEHLIKVAAIGEASDAPFLRALKAEFGWPDSGRKGRTRVVPLGRWVDTVCCFLEGGYDGLVQMARDSAEDADFCIPVLEEMKTAESVSALLAIGGPVLASPETNVRLAARLAEGMNQLLSFKEAPAVGGAVEQQVRGFLHLLLGLELTAVQKASVVCALRGVGDEDSLSLVAGLPPFGGSWVGLEQVAIRKIKRRLRQRGEENTF